jgi:predicted dehydrogenase
MDSPKARIAVIGCGAISRSFHLPALSRKKEILGRTILVDRDQAQAKRLALEYGVHRTTSDHREVIGEVDGAIVAVPPEAHVSVCRDLLDGGIHVLCEKPLALSVAEIGTLLAAASESGAVLAVNQNRRLFPSAQSVRDHVSEGTLGELHRIELSSGFVYDWPLQSRGPFGLGGSGHGVLLDLGAHDLDLVCWWLGRKPKLVDYRDDSFGGSEAMAAVELEADGCRISVHLSWLSRLRNGFRVTGERGTLAGGTYDWKTISWTPSERPPKPVRLHPEIRSMLHVRELVIDNFLGVVAGEEAPLVSGLDVTASISLIEECYSRRTRFAMPWHSAMERVSYAR